MLWIWGAAGTVLSLKKAGALGEGGGTDELAVKRYWAGSPPRKLHIHLEAVTEAVAKGEVWSTI